KRLDSVCASCERSASNATTFGRLNRKCTNGISSSLPRSMPTSKSDGVRGKNNHPTVARPKIGRAGGCRLNRHTSCAPDSVRSSAVLSRRLPDAAASGSGDPTERRHEVAEGFLALGREPDQGRPVTCAALLGNLNQAAFFKVAQDLRKVGHRQTC